MSNASWLSHVRVCFLMFSKRREAYVVRINACIFLTFFSFFNFINFFNFTIIITFAAWKHYESYTNNGKGRLPCRQNDWLARAATANTIG